MSQPAFSARRLSASSQRPFLRPSEMAKSNGWDLGSPLSGGFNPPVTSDNLAVLIYKDRIGKAELLDRRRDLVSLLARMRACIAGIRFQLRNILIGD